MYAVTISVSICIVGGLMTRQSLPVKNGLVPLAHYKSNIQDVSISSRENKRRNLPHQNVVHDISVLGTWDGGLQTFSFPKLDTEDINWLFRYMLVPEVLLSVQRACNENSPQECSFPWDHASKGVLQGKIDHGTSWCSNQVAMQ